MQVVLRLISMNRAVKGLIRHFHRGDRVLTGGATFDSGGRRLPLPVDTRPDGSSVHCLLALDLEHQLLDESDLAYAFDLGFEVFAPLEII